MFKVVLNVAIIEEYCNVQINNSNNLLHSNNAIWRC